MTFSFKKNNSKEPTFSMVKINQGFFAAGYYYLKISNYSAVCIDDEKVNGVYKPFEEVFFADDFEIEKIYKKVSFIFE